MTDKIAVQRWQLVGATTVPEWHTVGRATTWSGAERIARRDGGTQQYGGLRHPDGGPLYGTVRAVQGSAVHRWDGNRFVSPAVEAAINAASLPGGFAADWTMTFADAITGEEYTTDGADDPDATRPEAAAYWAEVAEAQAEALEHEAKARAALEAGDLGIALAAIREAAECEHPEGAGGTYDRIMRALIEAAIAERHKELYVIVSRHTAAIEFIHREMPETKKAPVLASATVADVAGKIVIGNVPMNLAQHALEVHAVEFSGPPPRGTELSLSDMDAAGAKLTEYTVIGPEDRSTKGARDTYLVDRSYAYARPGTEPAGTYLKEK